MPINIREQVITQEEKILKSQSKENFLECVTPSSSFRGPSQRRLQCPQCGKKAARYIEYVTLLGETPYRGNLRVISKKRSGGYIRGEKINYTIYNLWDGESYSKFNYGYFDRYRCAVDWANDIVGRADNWRTDNGHT